ncbi:hypothetical protein [Mycolicibacterium canariasense]|nr:hypothetical protein [Mycolicibacterium canariasense]MCV7207853.1 hypothetical protein [Mycolicibacterium canariasense]
MTARTERPYATDLLDVLTQRAMAGLGALGTRMWAGAAVDTKYVRLQSG